MAPKRVPPLDREIAIAKVRMAEDAWNSRDLDRVSMAYPEDSFWRNGAKIFQGREGIRALRPGHSHCPNLAQTGRTTR